MKRQMSKVKSVFLLIKLLFCFLLIISCTVNNNDNSVKEPEYTVALLNTQDYPNCTFIYNISVEGSEIVSQKSTTDSFLKFSTSLSGRMQIRIYAVENNEKKAYAFFNCSSVTGCSLNLYEYKVKDFTIESFSNELALNAEKDIKIIAEYTDGTESVECDFTVDSSNKDVLSVSKMNDICKIKALSLGTAVLTVKCGEIQRTFTITVKNAGEISEVVLEKVSVVCENTQLKIGEIISLKAVAVYSNGAEKDITDEVDFSVIGEAAEINENELTGVSTGTVQVTASYENIDSNVCVVTIYEEMRTVVDYTLNIDSLLVGIGKEISLNVEYSDGSFGVVKNGFNVETPIPADYYAIPNEGGVWVLTATKICDVFILVDYNGIEKKFRLEVTEVITTRTLSGIEITGSSKMYVGTSNLLRVTAFYEEDVESENVTEVAKITCSDADIAEITGSKIILKSAGEVVISASYTENDITKTASLTINVCDSSDIDFDYLKSIVLYTDENAQEDFLPGIIGDFTKEITIDYNGENVTYTKIDGIEITADGAYVTVKSTVDGVKYLVSGKTDNGNLKIYSDYKFILSLDNVSLTSKNGGSAINIQSKKRCFVIQNGNCTFADMADGYNSLTASEDAKGAIFSEGQMIFCGEGSLDVTGNYKHAICSDDYIRIQSGKINVISAVTDAVHVSDCFILESGSLTVTNAGSNGVDCTDGFIAVTGGEVNISSVNDGISASYEEDEIILPYIEFLGGNVSVKTSGDKAHGLKTANDITIKNGVKLNIDVCGAGSKGLNCDGKLTLAGKQSEIVIVTSGDCHYDSANTQDPYSTAAGISCDSAYFYDGTVNVVSKGQAGKGLNAANYVLFDDVNATFKTSGSYYSNDENATFNGWARAVVCDGKIDFYSGKVSVYTESLGADGIKCGSFRLVEGGLYGTTVGHGLKVVGEMLMNGGEVELTSTGDDGINCDSSVKIERGAVAVTVSADAAKGIKADSDIMLGFTPNVIPGNPYIKVNVSGDYVYDSTDTADPYSASCGIKSGAKMYIYSGTYDISNSGQCGKGMISGDDMEIYGHEINMNITGAPFSSSERASYNGYPKAIKSKGVLKIGSEDINLAVAGCGLNIECTQGKGITAEGELIISDGAYITIGSTNSVCGHEGMESRSKITFNGGVTHIYAKDDCVNVGGSDSTSSKQLIVNDGYIYAEGGGDVIDSNGSIHFNGGTCIAVRTASGGNNSIDTDGTLEFNGGTVLAIGSSGDMWSDVSNYSGSCKSCVILAANGNGGFGGGMRPGSSSSSSGGSSSHSFSSLTAVDSSGKLVSYYNGLHSGVGLLYASDVATTLYKDATVSNIVYKYRDEKYSDNGEYVSGGTKVSSN
jgi:hypothetical protein